MYNKNFFEGTSVSVPSLFSPLEEYFTTHNSNGMSYEMHRMSETKRRKLLSGDGWLLKRGIRLVGEFGMPQLQPYNGSVDFPLHVDGSPAENIYNTYWTRLVGAYWQSIGLRVIPTASWGAASSFSYCFDGLPEDSVIAVCGVGHARLKGAETLWHEAIKRLVQKKHPTTIIVYGGNEPDERVFDTPIVYFKDFIKGKLRMLRPKKQRLIQPDYPLLNLSAGVEDGREILL